ncbi:hypothetical protein DERF_004713, partial [Dermatophagoides farinae]
MPKIFILSLNAIALLSTMIGGMVGGFNFLVITTTLPPRLQCHRHRLGHAHSDHDHVEEDHRQLYSRKGGPKQNPDGATICFFDPGNATKCCHNSPIII